MSVPVLPNNTKIHKAACASILLLCDLSMLLGMLVLPLQEMLLMTRAKSTAFVTMMAATGSRKAYSVTEGPIQQLARQERVAC